MQFWPFTLFVVFSMLASSTYAFRSQWTQSLRRSARFLSAESSQQPGAERFNKKINLTSSKVVDTITVKPGEKMFVCRCWQSTTFPLCDGSHSKHNKETGDNLGPAMVTVAK